MKVSELKEGDVLAEKIASLGLSGKLFRGLEKNEIKKIQKARREVWIKEGIRYVPVFFITIVAMILYGDLLSALFRIL